MKKSFVNTKNNLFTEEKSALKNNVKTQNYHQKSQQKEVVKESEYWEDEQNLGLPNEINFRKLMGCGG